jgi:hypothetical protein
MNWLRVVRTFAWLALFATIMRVQAAPKYSDWSMPVNLGPNVNSSFEDYFCDISKDGLSLYFSSTRPGFGGDDIWVSEREHESDPWGAPVNMGSLINTTFNERAPSLSRDGHFLFLVTDRPGFGAFDIWVSRRDHVHDNFGWGPPVNLGSAVNSSFNDVGPSFVQNDEDGTASIYFSSNPQGPGLFDIYVSVSSGGGPLAPAVLVSELSSPQAELRPSVRHDELEIFFTIGGGNPNLRNLWTSTRQSVSDAWSPPAPLSAAVNTPAEESFAAISSDGLSLFFTSNRVQPDASGGADLYVTTRRKVKP